MVEHQLDDADVDAIGEQPASAFMPQVVPAEIDPLELLGSLERGSAGLSRGFGGGKDGSNRSAAF